MNRLGLGLAVGAGYVLGRTKKMKLAFAVGTMVAGKRMHLSPRALADLVSQQLQNNPQFKEIGDQLREDLRGVGKAASGALVERQIEGLADRLHGRTAEVRDQLAGVVPDVPGIGGQDETDEPDDAYEDGDERDDRDEPDDEAADADREENPRPRKKTPPRKAAGKKTAAKKSAAKKTVGHQGPAKKPPAKKSAAAKTSARRPAGARLPKGGGDDE
ncbi:DNA primase [Streptomyces mirabilis]|uniref:DNA primase n=1 Tax=Streptomyces mirabilis TaxID=68239 RepID=UPI00368F3A36